MRPRLAYSRPVSRVRWRSFVTRGRDVLLWPPGAGRDPGWQALPFLTSDTSQVIGLVNLSLAVSLAVNVVYLFYDPPWLKSLGDLVTSGIGLAVAIRIWQVFPFAFHGSSAWWSTAARVLLILVIVGSAMSIVVQAVSLARRAIHPHPHGGRLITRT